MALSMFTVPATTAHPFFDLENPPSLKQHKRSEIEILSQVWGVSEECDLNFGYDVLKRLSDLGGSWNFFVGNLCNAVNLNGNTYQQVPVPWTNYGAMPVFKAKMYKTQFWRLIEPPFAPQTDTTQEITESYTTTVENLQAFESTITAGVSATVGASGFGMSAEVTASLEVSKRVLNEAKNSASRTSEHKNTFTFKADQTYANWRKVHRYDLVVLPEYADGNPFAPFSPEIIQLLLPVTITQTMPLGDYGDSCETSKIGQGG